MGHLLQCSPILPISHFDPFPNHWNILSFCLFVLFCLSVLFCLFGLLSFCFCTLCFQSVQLGIEWAEVGGCLTISGIPHNWGLLCHTSFCPLSFFMLYNQWAYLTIGGCPGMFFVFVCWVNLTYKSEMQISWASQSAAYLKIGNWPAMSFVLVK